LLADATHPIERARLLGFSDFLALGTAALGAALAGVVLGTLGLGALVGLGASLALLPVLLFAARRPRQRVRAGVIRPTEPEPRC
jgi:hypothetical protein